MSVSHSASGLAAVNCRLTRSSCVAVRIVAELAKHPGAEDGPQARRELQDLAKDEVAAHIQREVSHQLEELGDRTREAVSAATQKVIAEFDWFGESLLGTETYWQTRPT
jgi:hypothetical protein